ncbi:MAG: glycine--tRNA ligase subunit beta [Rhodospirillaceae bacterium]
MAELFIELFSEDIPARMQARGADDFRRLATEKLKAAGLSFDRAEAQSTPRRLALVVYGLPLAQPDVCEEKRGPRVGAPEAAAAGFLKSVGFTSLEQCEKRDTGKGVFWFAVIQKPGRTTAEVLPALVEAVIREMTWPKSMRWSDTTFRWVRPLHSIIALFDGKLLEGGLTIAAREMPPRPEGNVCMAGELSATQLPFGASTRGHRFMAPDAFTVDSYAAYRDGLRKAYVLLDRDERKALIAADAARLAAAEGLTIAPDDGLLDEVAGLVEWPVVLLGTIDQRFMDVPAEVLITSMRTHQKYFATRTANGALGPRFVVVANMVTDDGGLAVVAGNQRVLRARLSDARFFWDQDRKATLESRVEALKAITFHAKLGTVHDKIERLQELVAALAEKIGADADQAKRAALLAKADLTTGMVGEFPELQGVMGRYYALADGENPAVADAIAAHYKPLGPTDSCPTAPVSVAVALADKLDSLVGFFGIDEKPTGSKDPYALRRAALGVIRLVLENRLSINLFEFIRLSLDLHIDKVMSIRMNCQRAVANGIMQELVVDRTKVRQDVLEFFADRLKVVLRERGVRHDLIDAVFALGGEDDLVRLLARVEALGVFLGTEDGANLLVAYRRAANIVRIEEKKDGVSHDGLPKTDLLVAPEEKALEKALSEARVNIKPLLDVEDFGGVMAELARLRAPVDAFFTNVTVNTDDGETRLNRLRLLFQIRVTMNAIADFSKIEG